MENGLEVIVVQIEPSAAKEVLEDIVSPDWSDLSKDDVVVVSFLELV